ncbi:histidine phosphatase family protein [Alteribacter populi]|uniref:histidine phosphatase family protein n=1 Tax=Alteribacter populi TaxID=2011011 RepID=UPI000BBA9BE5|nr:histidine phosphatase family protein [Alteribacter populi]
MRIGLLRHFEVERGYPNSFIRASELIKWVDEYDESDVTETDVDLQKIDWQRCFSSDLKRADITARKVFDKDIEFRSELREVRMAPFIKWNIRIPLLLHLLFLRVAWLFNHQSQPESKKDVMARINVSLDEILESKNDVLIVGHGGIMLLMRKELVNRGFKGPNFKRPANGKLYIFED